MDLAELQQELHVWRERNFPNDVENSIINSILGMAEEMGELQHAFLKQRQGIRGSYEEHEDAMRDAIADLLIYTLGLCSYKGWNLMNLVSSVAINDVLRRDWLMYPGNGTSE